MALYDAPRKRFLTTVTVALIGSVLIVIVTAFLGRAAHNLQGALIEKPDIAIYLLLPEEGINAATLLREKETEREYLVETDEGPKLVTLRKGQKEWEVAKVEKLHE